TFIDLFFFSYLQIKIQDKTLNVKTEDKIEFSKVEHLFESYKSFIKNYLGNDKKSILTEIKEYALIFQENFDFDTIENELTDQSGIERINAIIFGLDTSTLIPFVLYVLKNVSNDTDRNELFDFLETYILRRMVVHANTKNYNQLFTDRLINNEILSKKQFLEFLEGQADKVNFLPSDEELKQGFDSSYLINKQSAGILYFIESKIRNRSLQSTQLLGINKYSLEHLMPKKWENHWGKLSNQEDKIKRNRKLLTLGNLTIITQALNSTIRDANWTVKRKGKADKKGLNTYSAGLETMSHYLTLDEWNEQTIEERATFLYDKAKEIWKI
ncbi:MAG: HNH endonuclease family protein, partial [Deltaproteobacteria bacterium]|nr:HNH endonuclease family protein [Candidatus Kapabacteria bacterium]